MKNNTILKLHIYICRVEILMYFCMKKREKLGGDWHYIKIKNRYGTFSNFFEYNAGYKSDRHNSRIGKTA